MKTSSIFLSCLLAQIIFFVIMGSILVYESLFGTLVSWLMLVNFVLLIIILLIKEERMK